MKEHVSRVAMPRRVATLALIGGMLWGMVGCNTVEGFGEDLQALGGAMSQKAGNKAGDGDEGSEAAE